MSREDPLAALEQHMEVIDHKRQRTRAIRRTLASWFVTFLLIAMLVRTLANEL